MGSDIVRFVSQPAQHPPQQPAQRLAQHAPPHNGSCAGDGTRVGGSPVQPHPQAQQSPTPTVTITSDADVPDIIIPFKVDWVLIEDSFNIRGQPLLIAKRLVAGQRYKTIAKEMGLEVPTVRTYYQRLCQALKVPHNHTAVVRKIYETCIEHMQQKHRKEIEGLMREIAPLKQEITELRQRCQTPDDGPLLLGP